MALNFFKVSALPTTLQADSFYFVQNGNYAESYLTTSDGTAKSIGNTAMINALATAAANTAIASAAANPVEIVADIAARNALTTASTTNKLILVRDATADTTVGSGAALYVFEKSNNTTSKIAEYEGLDVVLTWANLQGRPTSAPSEIDDAVSKRHTHSNLATLNKLGESGGSLTFNGANVSTIWNTLNW